MEKEKSLRELDEIVEISNLYDFYGALLKENHREILEDYIWNNLSLAEIAKEREITRQGVYDIVKRSCKRLREYEAKLNLVEKFQITKEKLRKVEEFAGQGTDKETAKEILLLAKEIYEII